MRDRQLIRNTAAAFVLVACAACAPSAPPVESVAGAAQGTTYSLQWASGTANPEAVASAASAELERIDALLSTYRSDSVLERFNASTSTDPQPLPAELVTLLRLAKRMHAASDGCFDPTVRPLVHVWGFDTDDPAEPDPAALALAREPVGLDKLEIVDEEHVRKSRAELALDMSSIGQGYTANRLADVLESLGAASYLVEIGGEIVARGAKPDGSSWRVGVENPADDGPSPKLTLPPDRRSAVVTSGTYRHFFDAEGRRFSHILDPRTGYPVQHDLVSVTVAASDGATAGAWGTALLCLGPEAARLVAEREHVAAFLWTREGTEYALERTAALQTDWANWLD